MSQHPRFLYALSERKHDMKQKIIRATLAATQAKWMRPALTVVALVVVVLAATGCPHPH